MRIRNVLKSKKNYNFSWILKNRINKFQFEVRSLKISISRLFFSQISLSIKFKN